MLLDHIFYFLVLCGSPDPLPFHLKIGTSYLGLHPFPDSLGCVLTYMHDFFSFFSLSFELIYFPSTCCSFFLNVFFPSGIRFSEWNILASSKPSSPFYLKRPNFIYIFVFSSRWLMILFMILFSLISDYFWLNSEKPRQDCLIVTKAIFASSILFLVGFPVTGHLKAPVIHDCTPPLFIVWFEFISTRHFGLPLAEDTQICLFSLR